MTARNVLDKAMSEDEYVAQIIDLAETCGWSVWHDNDSRRNDAGFPDWELLRGPDMLRLEVKSETGVVQPAQRAYIARLQQIKFVYAAVVRPSDADELFRVLKARTRE
jgi:hypothetical protein